MTVQQIKHIVRQYNLDTHILEQMDEQGSVVSKYLRSFTLHFVATHLPPENRNDFARMLLDADITGQTSDYDQIWDFVKKHIPDFDEKFALALSQQVNQMKRKIISV